MRKGSSPNLLRPERVGKHEPWEGHSPTLGVANAYYVGNGGEAPPTWLTDYFRPKYLRSESHLSGLPFTRHVPGWIGKPIPRTMLSAALVRDVARKRTNHPFSIYGLRSSPAGEKMESGVSTSNFTSFKRAIVMPMLLERSRSCLRTRKDFVETHSVNG